MLRSLLCLLILGLMLTACGEVRTIEGRVSGVEPNRFIVECSDEVNKGKHFGNIEDVEYLCTITLNEETHYRDAEGTPLQPEDFANGDVVRVTLAQAEKVTKRNRTFGAAEIVRLARAYTKKEHATGKIKDAPR